MHEGYDKNNKLNQGKYLISPIEEIRIKYKDYCTLNSKNWNNNFKNTQINEIKSNNSESIEIKKLKEELNYNKKIIEKQNYKIKELEEQLMKLNNINQNSQIKE